MFEYFYSIRGYIDVWKFFFLFKFVLYFVDRRLKKFVPKLQADSQDQVGLLRFFEFPYRIPTFSSRWFHETYPFWFFVVGLTNAVLFFYLIPPLVLAFVKVFI